VQVDLRGPYLCSRAMLPIMIARHSGRIINVSSGAGLRPIAYWTAYTITKAALLHFTETMALETAEHGVSVFSVIPALSGHLTPWSPQRDRNGRPGSAIFSMKAAMCRWNVPHN